MIWRTMQDLLVPRNLKQKNELWLVRVGDYHIVYLIEDVIQVIEVQKVGHRKDIYK